MGENVFFLALTAVSVATGAAEAMAALPIFAAPFSCLAGHRQINKQKRAFQDKNIRKSLSRKLMRFFRRFASAQDSFI